MYIKLRKIIEEYLSKPCSVVIGVITYVPGLSKFIFSKLPTATISTRYCYSVWLRHISIAYKSGLLSTFPNVIAELGPGSSLGVGLAGLLCGASKYYAFDVVKRVYNKRNIEIFDELISLFKRREKIPDENEFSPLLACLESYEFPNYLLTDERLNKSLKDSRIEAIRKALLNFGNLNNKDNIQIAYFAPWYVPDVIKQESVDMIFSEGVMEHVSDLSYTYEQLYCWLKPGGFISHKIDFYSHGTSKDWNGHWTHSDFVWKLIKGKRPYLINREPHSVHINLIEKLGFEIVCDIKIKDTSGIKRTSLARRFKNMSDDDLTTRSAFIQAIKK